MTQGQQTGSAARKKKASRKRPAKSEGKDPGGRPEVEIHPEELKKLARMQCTNEEIAAWFDCSARTIQRHLKKYPDLKEVIEIGRARGRVSVRRAQFELLALNDRVMAIYLGKVLLGQNDRRRDFEGEVPPAGEIKFDVSPAKSDVKVTNAAK